MKDKEHTIDEYSIIFEKLVEVKDEQMINTGLTESDYSEIHESVQKLQEIQQSIDLSSYTFFTRS
jgi:hypothetical protein